MKYTVIFEHGARSVSAYVPDLPDADAFAPAIAAHIASSRETGQDVPARISHLEQLEVAV